MVKNYGVRQLITGSVHTSYLTKFKKFKKESYLKKDALYPGRTLLIFANRFSISPLLLSTAETVADFVAAKGFFLPPVDPPEAGTAVAVGGVTPPERASVADAAATARASAADLAAAVRSSMSAVEGAAVVAAAAAVEATSSAVAGGGPAVASFTASVAEVRALAAAASAVAAVIHSS